MAVIHEDNLAWSDRTHGERWGVVRKQLGAAAGGVAIGTSLVELLPGRSSWPRHYHLGNEEAIYVLAGEGTIRLGDRDLPLRPGHYVALPPGEAHAHVVHNTGTGPLRYLAISTMQEPDVIVYPDSGKVGIFAGTPPGGSPESRTLHAYLPLDAAVDYWKGEE